MSRSDKSNNFRYSKYRLKMKGRKGSKSNLNSTSFKLIHSNIDGYISKRERVYSIVQYSKPDVITFNETALKGKKVNINGYFSYQKNRLKNKGGVATVVANYLKGNTVLVDEGGNDLEEFLVTRHDNVHPPINVINIYGAQESRTNKEDIERINIKIKNIIEKCEIRGETIILIGDMNAKVGNDEYGIMNHSQDISQNGRFYRDLIKSGKYYFANNMNKSDKQWTWISRQNGNVRSCLDIIIVSVVLKQFLTKFEIDTGKTITPRRVNVNKITYTDHFTIVAEFSNLPKGKINPILL